MREDPRGALPHLGERGNTRRWNLGSTARATEGQILKAMSNSTGAHRDRTFHAGSRLLRCLPHPANHASGQTPSP
jgi:hypothetical protein